MNDILAGDSDGNVWLFLNVGTKEEPELAAGVRVEAAGKPITGRTRTYRRGDGENEVEETVPRSHELADIYSKLHMADWNGDGLRDLLIGQNSTMVWYENVGSKTEPQFTGPREIVPAEGDFPSRPSPYVIDWDGDGVQDLLVGSDRPQIFLFRNRGTREEPELAEGMDLGLTGEGFQGNYRLRFDVADWDGDGSLDILAGDRYSRKDGEASVRGGNIWFFRGQ